MAEIDPKKALDCIATAAQTVREAISASLPVGPSQLMTMQIPGLVINPADYLSNDTATQAFASTYVRVNEARLVDNMVPVAKMMMGRTGKSVARSYLAALDLLVPVDASVSGAVASRKPNVDGRLKMIQDRYDQAMKNLTEKAEDSNKTKVQKYVEKQENWNHVMQQYSAAQQTQLERAKLQGRDIDEQRKIFLDWLQTHTREYKAAIQARYMDWVVHGYKFLVEFNFGVVDISSGMARIEASKEAYRNLTLIDSDGASEYQGVKLNPSNWATIVANAYNSFNTHHKGRSPLDLRSELKRLRSLLISHQAMLEAVDKDEFLPVIDGTSKPELDTTLKGAYVGSYKAIDVANETTMMLDTSDPLKAGELGTLAKPDKEGAKPPEDPTKEKTKVSTADANAAVVDKFGLLRKAQEQWSQNNLVANTKANRNNSAGIKGASKEYLEGRIKQLSGEIADIQKQLSAVGKPAFRLPIIDGDGRTIEDVEVKQVPYDSEDTGTKPSPWTRISTKVSTSKKDDEKVSSSSESSFAAKARWGFWSVEGGASHAATSAKAMTKMSNLDVEVSFDAMLVEIERPWMRPELFSDQELDCAEDFKLSPGPEALLESVAQNKQVAAEYTEFCSYPTAFVVAANVELEFSGDTSALESSLESSSTQANVEVGYGPFAISASHKQSKSKAKTHAESTATGMRISLQAPQIISWVSELLPQLPRTKNSSKMLGMKLAEKPLPLVSTRA